MAEYKMSGRVTALDGWRGIAILLVLFDHVQWQWLGRYHRSWSETGQHGVTLFFVLSGFLITSNLIKSGTSLKRFYLRRCFRLMPAAWSYLLVLVFLGVFFPTGAMPRRELAGCLFFFRNYLHYNSLFSAPHFWSLSIEEQFYTVWPALLLFVGKHRAKWVLICVVFAAVVLRNQFATFYHQPWNNYRTEVRVDAICIGCLAAILLNYPNIEYAARTWLPKLWLPAFGVFLFCAVSYHELPPLLESIALAALISAAAILPELIQNQWLSTKPLVWLGQISYSIYIWQQFIHHGHGTPTNLAIDCLVLVLALASFYLVERSSILLGYRLQSRWASLGPQEADQIATN